MNVVQIAKRLNLSLITQNVWNNIDEFAQCDGIENFVTNRNDCSHWLAAVYYLE